MKKLIIGTRGSQLARWQAQLVADRLKETYPHLEIEMREIHTRGDKILDVALAKIGDKGLFTKEIEDALLRREIDLAVHSLKDVPTEIGAGLSIGAVMEREEPYDVMLSLKGYTLDTLPRGAKVGTSSLRRRAQLLSARPDLEIVDLRGNLDTRVRRMKEMELAAVVLAWAGVKRMGYEELITQVLKPPLIIPAAGQGALAVEIRADDEEVKSRLRPLDQEGVRYEVKAERAFLRTLGGGCQVPVGALARLKGGELFLEGVIADLKGEQVIRVKGSGPCQRASELGEGLAQSALEKGGDAILKKIYAESAQITGGLE